MQEIRNKETGQVRLVPEGTANAVRTEKWLIKQGWLVVEHAPTPNEVIKFQEAKAPEPEPEIFQCCKNDEPCCKDTQQTSKVQQLTVKQVTAMINEFTEDELKILAGDPRKSVSGLANKKLQNG